MKTFLDELLAYKELLLELVKRDLRVKYDGGFHCFLVYVPF